MISRTIAFLFLLLAFAFPCFPVHADADEDQAQALVDKASPSIVTIRMVVKSSVKAGGQSNSSEDRIVSEGVVVRADGLIMMSSAPISSDFWKRMMGGGANDQIQVNLTPTDFKITIGNEEKEYTAYLAATDPKLGLAFIKIEDLADRKLTAVTFSDTAAARLGDTVATVTRLSKGYDYTPLYEKAYVTGTIAKPRAATILSGGIIAVGLPVFTQAGDALGVMTFLPTGLKAGDSDNTSSMMMHFFGGSATESVGIFLVPGSALASVIDEAQKAAATLATQRATKPAAAPAVKPATPAQAVPAPVSPKPATP